MKMDDKSETGFLIEENKRLRKAIEELSVLNEIATAISSTLSLTEIIDLIVWKCIKHLNVEQAAVMLLDENRPDDKLQTMIRKADTKTDGFVPLRLDSQITGWILKNRKPLLVKKVSSDKRFNNLLLKTSEIKSFLSVPMLSKGGIIGIITVFNKKDDGEFTEEDQKLLSIIAAQSTQTIVNARLLEEEKKLLQLRQELKTAAEIQKNILPQKIPKVHGYEISAVNIPAKEVGGDYYDFVLRNECELIFCLGDITGKGIPAAMLMANLQATFRSQAQIHKSLSDIIFSSNTLLHKSTEVDKYATLFAGIVDYKNHTLTYCNAGHNNPVKISAQGEIIKLSKGGIILGFMDAFPFDEETLQLDAGDLIVVYSDGITETMNEKGEEYGEERLMELLIDNFELSPSELISKIIGETEKHAMSEPQSDDKTLLILRRVK